MEISVGEEKVCENLVNGLTVFDDDLDDLVDDLVTNREWSVLSFDPPASSNMGWACFHVFQNEARLAESGVLDIPDGTGERLMAIERFIENLVEKHPCVRAMCFERAIGNGFAPVREKIGENTGVIKLVGANLGVEYVAVHTSTAAKVFTGSGSAIGKKSRIKRTAKDLFFPNQSYKQIAPDHNGGEKFEHQADAIQFACCYLMKNGVSVAAPGGKLLPIETKEDDQGDEWGDDGAN